MKITSVDLDLHREIERVDASFKDQEPMIHAFIPETRRFERLRREADALLERYPSEAGRPPLFGKLVGVKDIFHVSGFPTQAGSKLPPDALGGPEAESVSRLRAEGSLIVGKTVTTEFAYFSPGPTRNPRGLQHTPGGSSSGSAAAVAADLCSLALGTQTIGSIIRPAAFCGIVGVKPSFDRISTRGVIPLSPSLDHVGFFTADIDSAIEAARVIYEDWEMPEASPSRPVLGIPHGPYLRSASAAGLEHFDRVCQQLAGEGYALHRVGIMPDFDEIKARHDLILAAEAARVHEPWFSEYGSLYSAKTAELIRRGRSISEEKLADALDARARWRDELAKTTEENAVDAWIAPSARGAAPRGLQYTGDPVMNLPWTQAGWPVVNLPAGTDNGGLPLGLQVIGREGADEQLLERARDIERIVSPL